MHIIQIFAQLMSTHGSCYNPLLGHHHSHSHLWNQHTSVSIAQVHRPWSHFCHFCPNQIKTLSVNIVSKYHTINIQDIVFPIFKLKYAQSCSGFIPQIYSLVCIYIEPRNTKLHPHEVILIIASDNGHLAFIFVVALAICQCEMSTLVICLIVTWSRKQTKGLLHFSFHAEIPRNLTNC